MDTEKTEKEKGSAKKVLRATVKYTLLTFKWLFIMGIIAGFVAGGAAFGYVSALVKDDPVRDKETMLQQMNDDALTGFVYFRDDTVVGQLRTEEDRRLAGLNDIPQIVLDAVFAIEDKNFYEHMGVDIKGTARAVVQKLLNLDVQTGGSTITQQVARRVFLSLDKADSRKAKEIFLSMRLERMMSKEQILLAYLNKIPYGNGSSGYNAYGIKAAAKGIFNIEDLSKLNLAQAAYLAGLPQMPSNFSAFSSSGVFDGAAFKRAVQRQQLVLRRMLEENKITQQQYDEAIAFDLQSTLAERVKKAYSTYPFLMIEVEKEAAKALLKAEQPALDAQKQPDAYNEALKSMQAKLSRGGYHVYTTIDKEIYESMRDIAQNAKNFTPDDKVKGVEQVGAVMVENKTGAILGMLEGRDFFKEQMNHATQAYRQPGSTMKPIAAFLPALESGAIQPATVIDDVPIVLKDGTKAGYHIPENWDDGYHGLVTARHALNQSYNIPAIKLFTETVGIKEAWEFARKMGIQSVTEADYVAQTGVIGGLKYGVTVKELTNAYATIGNQGVYNEAFMIRKITDSNGKIVYEHENKPTTAFSQETAYLMSDMMRTVITSGTATDLKTKYKYYNKIPIVGKTGSTQDDADAWFMGYTPDVTLGVWVGYELPIHKLTKKSGGTNRAKDVWAMALNAAIEKHPDLFPTKEFKRPPNIVDMTVSSLSGKLPSDAIKAAGKLNKDIFNKKFVPTEEDNVLTRLPIITFNKINYIAQSGTPAEFVSEKTVIKREKPLGDLFKQIASIMNRLPADRKRSIDFFKPKDYDEDAPSETDPRTDDGKPPVAPGTVAATHSGQTSVITFQASPSEDTVGYRLYRSTSQGSYQKVEGKVLLAGEETKFTDQAGPGVFGYYVTAVDVAGRESVPSKAAYTDGTSVDLLFLTPDSDGAIDPAGVAPHPGQNPTPGGKPDTGASDKPDAGDEEWKKAPSAPAAPAVKSTGGGIELSWKANAAKEKVKSYTVYFSAKEDGEFTKLGTVSQATQFRYYAVSTEGFYRITATNEHGDSKPSPAKAFKKSSD
ncbi:penicillin-binding protein [Paenibacillus sp. UNCCL117]|uniref:transglycosylase domain-containing protein n=1 Tax=unclassified Paenibacillus TaxID=185978 RepID=UPI00087F3D7D|nr:MULTISPECIES: transglycosylase domain-containing protein [unclassified Paenibacillus]SDD99631.1 penicillin-binding protein [Paenibacillus sp. cl123]SFW55683.1 penicillin-binding protein [Paenibacillus sp. UNCCL117]